MAKKIKLGEAGEVLDRRCFCAHCPSCMKSKPQCKLSKEKVEKCKERENDKHPSLGYPGSVSRNAYSEFSRHRNYERSERQEARVRKQAREYRKLKREGKI